ncbi:dynamin family protein [Paenibacillus sp. HJGM_3]|uniref:dynamin family protein n=1 Tax=Paenibacillus sp. HJGM_3 TaxID=3379816 RepID=UPI00385B36A3
MNALHHFRETAATEAVAAIRERMAQEGDRTNAGKMGELAELAHDPLLRIAFCGHFSAGKSSLINKLCGHPLLPSSPIPTSANVVTIRSGTAGATIIPVASAGVAGGAAQPVEVPLDKLGEYARNGQEIASIEIRYPISLLDGKAAVLDTPGIDSTDAAHMLATESALHLADVVFYVMDYNHVQSEVNFAFCKRLKEWGKPLYLIVNQIDKHRERELTFDAYRVSVRQAFENWHIVPDGILYTSVKASDHPLNEWRKLERLVTELAGLSEPLRARSVIQSARHLSGMHTAWVSEQSEAEKQAAREALDEEALPAVLEQANAFDAELKAIAEQAQSYEQGLKKEIVHLLDNATITPAATRDLAHHYLQSRKPGFKVGFFSRAAATAKEIETRLAAFSADFAEQMQVHIVSHLRQLLIREAEAHAAGALAAADIDARLANAAGEANAEWLAAQVQSGASFSGEYTLNYSRQLAADAKSFFRREAFALAEALAARAAEAGRERAAALGAERGALEARLGAYRRLQALEAREAAYAAELAALLPAADAAALALPDPAGYPAAGAGAGAAGAGAAQPQTLARAAVPGAPAVSLRAASAGGAAGADAPVAGAPAAAGDPRGGMRRTAQRLTAGADLLAGIPAMQSIVAAMREKAERLTGSTFTIALFGAFSAGKSSFANALMGDAILPVSPNPTTAAINKIVPPTAEWPHGSVKVQMKSAEAMLDDVRFSLQVLGYNVASMDEALSQIDRLKPETVAPSGKPHYTFLKAVRRGWNFAAGQMGEVIRADLEEFRDYVAEESKSCYVAFIELHYACALTNQGMVLVDTPGADSINARHTGVAFDYIKNADAILFVTYYNHAFSQADREFLLQLGRVKETFELDKMFFVVNAADLAADEQELAGVVGHVTTNLLQYGIRHPRIYPVSSLSALDGKMGGDAALLEQSGIVPFERDFVRFAFEELADLAVQAAEQDLERADGVLRQWIEGAQAGEAERKQRIERLREALHRVEALLNAPNTAEELGEAAKEAAELLYYVKQRLFYRFGELYTYAFNPASLREDAGPIRSLLRAATVDLIRLISYDLSQELLATTLRVEQALNKLARKRADKNAARIREELPTFEASAPAPTKYTTPAVEETLTGVQIEEKEVSGLYKSGKHFFEGSGRTQLKELLEKKFQEPVASYIERHQALIERTYADQYDSAVAQLHEQQRRAAREHVEGLLDALEMKHDLSELQRLQERFSELLRSSSCPT